LTATLSRDLSYALTGVRFEEDGHRYYLTNDQGAEERIVSATQALAICGLRERYDGVPQSVLLQASQRGTAVHLALPLLLDDLLDWNSVDERIIRYVENLALALDEIKFKAWNCEDPVASHRIRIGCRPDGFGVALAYGEDPAILEIKTGARTEARGDSALLQASMYSIAVTEAVMRERREAIFPKRILIWLQKDGHRIEAVEPRLMDEMDAEAAVRVAWRHIRQSKGEFV
jgi:hypothetical protein